MSLLFIAEDAFLIKNRLGLRVESKRKGDVYFFFIRDAFKTRSFETDTKQQDLETKTETRLGVARP